MSHRSVATALSQGPCPSFYALASRYLGEYLAKIEVAVELLDDDQVWWRPAGGTNSVGNLLLHLAGNLSLWLGQGLDGVPYARDRAGEFAAERTLGRGELVARLAAVVARCQGILAGRDGEPLARRIDVQTYETDALGVVFHAVEHMSYHTGQIVWIAKELGAGREPLEFYPRHRAE